MQEFSQNSPSVLRELVMSLDGLDVEILDVMLISLAILLLVTKLGGEICARLSLPTVLGELLAGVLIGVSGIHLLVFNEEPTLPFFWQEFLHNVYHLSNTDVVGLFSFNTKVISLLSDIGLIILLFEVGLESDLSELLKVGKQAFVVALVGVVVPFSLGTFGLMYFFSVPLISAVFAGAAMTATSIGITAKVLSDLDALKTTEGQIIVGAAIIDDILGIIILAVVGSLLRTGEIEIYSLFYLLVASIFFLVGAIVIGRLFTKFIMGLTEKMQTRGQLMVPSLFFAFLLASIAHHVGLEAIIGSFAAGLLLAESEKGEELKRLIAPVADLIVPIFFVCIGARTDLGILYPSNATNREGLIISVFLIVVAILGKLSTIFSVWDKDLNRMAIGVGMIPRGEVGLVFAAIGSGTNLISPAIITSIILMVMITTFLSPSLLRSVLSKSKEEQLS